MRIAILSDIHANREAFDAVLEIVRDLGPDETVLLGDLVGYGPDPVHAIEMAAELIAGGALCILGNHDEAVVQPRDGMTENARVAAEWTRAQLSPAHLEFLRNLPLSLVSNDRLYVHASADRSAQWQYMRDAEAAERCLSSSLAHTIFCGHTHIPAVYYALPGKRPVHFRPHDDIPAPLSPLRRHVVVVGSVGQPRDGNPAACFAMVDTGRRTVTMIRTPYDCDKTAGKIAAWGLPAWLGMRLKIGR